MSPRKIVGNILVFCLIAAILEGILGLIEVGPGGGDTQSLNLSQPTFTIRADCGTQPPLTGVGDPEKLLLRASCVTVRGTVACVIPQPDGDTHVLLKLDAEFVNRLTIGNDGAICQKEGDFSPHLVVEILPQSCNPLGPDPTNCAGNFFQTPQVPKVGAYIEVSGPYVWDTGMSYWGEIHPARKITIL